MHLTKGFHQKKYREARSARAASFAFRFALCRRGLKPSSAQKFFLFIIIVVVDFIIKGFVLITKLAAICHCNIFFKLIFQLKINFCFSNTMSVPDNLRSTHSEKTLNATKAPRSVKRITFNPSEANPGEKLYVHVPKLNENEVLVPGSLALRFDIDIGGHANNFLVQNVSRAIVSKMTVMFGRTTLEETVDYDVYKTFSDLFLPGEKRDNMVPEGIQSEDLCKICSGAGDAKTTGVDAEKILNGIYGKKIPHQFDHQILTDHGIFLSTSTAQ